MGQSAPGPAPPIILDQALFVVPQSSPYHACHQLILPEGESGAHLRAGTRGTSAQGGGGWGRRKRKGREARPSNLCAPQTGHLWDSSFPVTPSDCSGERDKRVPETAVKLFANGPRLPSRISCSVTGKTEFFLRRARKGMASSMRRVEH